MQDKHNLDELEKRVDELRREAHELKVLIHSIRRQNVGEEQRPINQAANVVPEQRNEKHIPLPQKQKKVVQKEQIDWEKQIGQVWLPRIFIFVLLLGVVWAFKAASDFGIINEPVKVLLGYLSSAILIYLGLLQIKKKRIALGQVLLGGSVVLLLIVTFAMHVLYDLVPLVVAFPLNIVWIGLGIFFANRYQSQPLAIVTAIGGYLIPFLIESQNPNVFQFITFETIFYGALLAFAILKKFNILYHVAFAFLHFTLLAGALIQSNGDIDYFAFAVIVQHIFLLGGYLLFRSFDKEQLGILFGSFLLMLAWTRAAFTDGTFEWLLLIFIILYVFLSFLLWKPSKEKLAGTLSIASIAILAYLVSRFEVEDISGVLLVQGMISFYLGIRAQSKLKQAVGSLIFVVSSYVIFLMQFHEIFSIEFINWILLIGAIFVLPKLIAQVEWIKDVTRDSLYKLLQIINMVLLLFFITLTVSALTNDLELSMQYMMVSFAWAIYAFVGIVLGSQRDNKPLRVFGLTLLFITLGKLIFFDLSYVSIFIRAILFIGLGVIGILGSRVFYRGKSNK
ncbi:DUF2339 domain-containing protein [Fredinandcohnia sp. 179-A 10B2 NHS]|uniref:DUF2339 domain-containing protein n=1 Tax=Fredinandcohnia sp. 179-A 10B2 NHS TaxID=3235176 RepID=UPI0039A04789